MNRVGRWLCCLLIPSFVLTALLGCGGSTKKDKIWIYQYPRFYRPDLRRIAVLPFGNRTRVRGVGERISDKVSALLTNNGTYEVYTRVHLKDILTELDLAEAGIIEPEAAKRIGKLKSVQALVCGVVDRFHAGAKSETRYNRVPIWGRNAQGMPVITGWKNVPYRWTRNDAVVESHVVVIDCGTGRQLYAFNRPSKAWAQGSPPKHAPQSLLESAERDQVNRIVRAIAVTRSPIKLEGDVLKTAASLYEGNWEWQRRFTPGDEKLYAVVDLPSSAHRNNFELTIVPVGEREIVARQAFRWTKKYARYGYTFKIDPIVQEHGLGAYRVKLYSGPAERTEPIATYDFSIVENP